MATGDIHNQMKEITQKISILQQGTNNGIYVNVNIRTPVTIIQEYMELNQNVKVSVNKKRKEMERKIQTIKDNHRYIEQDVTSYQVISTKHAEIMDLQNQYDSLNTHFITGIQNVLRLLKEKGFIIGDITNETTLSLTLQGLIAANIREIHCLVFSPMDFNKLSTKQLVALFSCFTNVRVMDDFKNNVPSSNDETVNQVVKEVKHMYDRYQDEESANNINTGFDYNIHYDLLNYVERWCDCETAEECKFILHELEVNKEIFLGDFVKALLKINNISVELEKIAEMTGNIVLLSKLKDIPRMTLKYVVTNQSLYVHIHLFKKDGVKTL
jgi:hypothetical protein